MHGLKWFQPRLANGPPAWQESEGGWDQQLFTVVFATSYLRHTKHTHTHKPKNTQTVILDDIHQDDTASADSPSRLRKMYGIQNKMYGLHSCVGICIPGACITNIVRIWLTEKLKSVIHDKTTS